MNRDKSHKNSAITSPYPGIVWQVLKSDKTTTKKCHYFMGKSLRTLPWVSSTWQGSINKHRKWGRCGKASAPRLTSLCTWRQWSSPSGSWTTSNVGGCATRSRSVLSRVLAVLSLTWVRVPAPPPPNCKDSLMFPEVRSPQPWTHLTFAFGAIVNPVLCRGVALDPHDNPGSRILWISPLYRWGPWTSSASEVLEPTFSPPWEDMDQISIVKKNEPRGVTAMRLHLQDEQLINACGRF